MLRSSSSFLSALQLIILLASNFAAAAVIFSTVSHRELSVGDRILYSVSMLVPKEAAVVPPDPVKDFGNLAVKGWNRSKKELAQADSVCFEYEITTYRAENCTIPPLSYVLVKNDSTDTLNTESVPLTVIPLCTNDSADIKDLKPQQVTGRRLLLWLWLMLGAASAVSAAFAVLWFLRKRRKPLPLPPPKPPYDEAMEALAALEAKQYLMKGLVREHVFKLSEILKRYIERTHNVNAAEFTTEEMLAWLGIAHLEKELKASLEWFFRSADPVKFAKFHPDNDTAVRFSIEARKFIEATRPREPSDASHRTNPTEGVRK